MYTYQVDEQTRGCVRWYRANACPRKCLFACFARTAPAKIPRDQSTPNWKRCLHWPRHCVPNARKKKEVPKVPMLQRKGEWTPSPQAQRWIQAQSTTACLLRPYLPANLFVCTQHPEGRLQTKQLEGTTSHASWQGAVREPAGLEPAQPTAHG